jgi:invasion protein IalB
MTPAIRALGLALLLAIGLAATASAQEPQVIGTFRDWKAYVYQSGNQKVCYMASSPKKAEGNYSSRGKIWMLITRRSPGPKDVVSIITGYNYKTDSSVRVSIGSGNFSLFTQGDTAWTRDVSDDASMVAAMKAGVDMVVVGTSERGTETRDTYSLLGFTAAYDAIRQACTN